MSLGTGQDRTGQDRTGQDRTGDRTRQVDKTRQDMCYVLCVSVCPEVVCA